MEMLKTSPHLQTVERVDGFAVFHALFGRLSHIDAKTSELLDTLRQPAPRKKIISTYSNGKSRELDALLDELQNRSFIVPADTDEYEAVRRDMRFRELCLPSGYLVRALQLIISNQCNFGCKFCFFKDHNSASRLDLVDSELNMNMTQEMAKKAIENVLEVQRKHGHPYLAVEFFGGEPLMNWPLIKYVLEAFGRNDHPDYPRIKYSITTNGKALTREMAEIFKKYDVTVTISYNFPTGGDFTIVNETANYRDVTESLRIIKEVGNNLTFNTVLSADALEYFDSRSYVDFCLDNHVQMIGLILDLNLDFYRDPKNSDKAMATIMNTYRYAKQQGIPVVGYWHEPFAQLSGHQALNFESGFKCCPGEGCKLSVEPEGHVFVCKGCSERIGHISELEDVFSNPQYKEYAFHAYRNAPACEGCMIENFCSTGCMGSIERHYQTINAVDEPWCKVFREITLRLIREMEIAEFGSNQLFFPSEV